MNAHTKASFYQEDNELLTITILIIKHVLNEGTEYTVLSLIERLSWPVQSCFHKMQALNEPLNCLFPNIIQKGF